MLKEGTIKGEVMEGEIAPDAAKQIGREQSFMGLNLR